MKDRLFSQDDSVNAVVKKRKREFKEELQEEKSLRYGIDQDDDDDHYGELGPQNIVMSVSHQSGRYIWRRMLTFFVAEITFQ